MTKRPKEVWTMPKYKRTTIKVNSGKADPVLLNMKYIAYLHLLQLCSLFDDESKEDSFEQLRLLEEQTPKETLPMVIEQKDNSPIEFNTEKGLWHKLDNFMTTFEGPFIYGLYSISISILWLLGMPLSYAVCSMIGAYLFTLYITVKYEQYKYNDINDGTKGEKKGWRDEE